MFKFFTKPTPVWSEWSDIIISLNGIPFQVKFDLTTGEMVGEGFGVPFDQLVHYPESIEQINIFRDKVLSNNIDAQNKVNRSTKSSPEWSEWSYAIGSRHSNLFQVRFDLTTGRMEGKAYNSTFSKLAFSKLILDCEGVEKINSYKHKVMSKLGDR